LARVLAIRHAAQDRLQPENLSNQPAFDRNSSPPIREISVIRGLFFGRRMNHGFPSAAFGRNQLSLPSAAFGRNQLSHG